MCKMLAKNIQLYGSWARQSFQFFRQNKIPGFLKTIEHCLNFGMGLCIT